MSYFIRREIWLFMVLFAATLGGAIAHAGTVSISIWDTGYASPGSVGNSFEVLLSNTGQDLAVGAFTFEVASVSDIILADADFTTAAVPYIFAGDSLIGPSILGATSGQDLTAFDLGAAGDVTIPSGATVSLGRVLYDVSPSAAPGIFTVSLINTGTSLSDALGDSVTIDTLTNGQLEITTTPEPASLALVGVGLALAGGLWRKRLVRRQP